jgi:hypothetical protein
MNRLRLGAKWLGLVVVVFGLFSCEAANQNSSEPVRKQVLAWEPKEQALTSANTQNGSIAGGNSGQVGTDCIAGESACRTGVCIHSSDKVDQGYFCSARCESDKNCPEKWRCYEMLPGDAQSKLCFPPKNWVAKVAKIDEAYEPVRKKWRADLNDIPMAARALGVPVWFDAGVRDGGGQ